jgi:hypothetical protein
MKNKFVRVVAYVGIAGLIGGLTKLGTMLGVLDLSASNIAFTTVVIIAAINVLTALETKLD